MEDVDVWYPRIFIGNFVESMNLIAFHKDADEINSLWYHYPDNRVHYATVMTTTISCPMNFETFPFDTHECTMDLKNWIGKNSRVELNTPIILTNDENDNEIGGKDFELGVRSGMNYDFFFKALPPTTFVDDGHQYSMVQIKINFDRTAKSRNKVFSAYHAQTTTLSLLSLLSYFTPPEAPVDR